METRTDRNLERAAMLQRRLPWRCNNIYQEDFYIGPSEHEHHQAIKLFSDGLRDAFHQGCEIGELITLLGASWDEQRRSIFDVTRFALSAFHPAHTQYKHWRLGSAFNAACLQGALLTINERVTRQKKLLDKETNTFLNRQYHILRMSMQHQLTRAWMHLPRFLRKIVEYRWYKHEPYAGSMQRWQDRCLGSARVSTVALSFLSIPGDWRGFVPSPEQDEKKLDLILEGEAAIEGKSSDVGLLVQIKGSKRGESSAHIITYTNNPAPDAISAKEWEELTILWRLEEFQGLDRPYYPILVTVGTPKNISPYHFEATVPEVSNAIRKAFQG